MKYILKPIETMNCFYEVSEADKTIWINGVKYQLNACDQNGSYYLVDFIEYDTRRDVEHYKKSVAEDGRSDQSQGLVFDCFHDGSFEPIMAFSVLMKHLT